MAMLAGSAGVSGLANEIYVEIGVEFPTSVSTEVDADRKKWCNLMARAIITHITANATVATTVAVTNVTAVTPGVGSSGPGVGTGTGAVS